YRHMQATQARCDAVEAQHDALRAELIDCYGALVVASDDARHARLETLAEEIELLTDAAGALSVRIDATAPTSAEGAAIKLQMLLEAVQNRAGIVRPDYASRTIRHALAVLSGPEAA
ncbi:hypothetical protein, partial [Acidisphaera rubrifaciens]|uniref:hypothetical protein n=1 Tax=Acidisphaera rubrifaciens TaxID=50715 RepID=UPI0019D6B8E5